MTDPETRHTLEPLQIITGAFLYPYVLRAALFRVLILPLSLFIALELVPTAGPEALADPAVLLLTMILGLVLQIFAAVNIHRVILLGEQAVPALGIRAWTMREWRFLAHMFLLPLCTLPVVALALIPAVGWIAAVILGLWILSRLSLVLPAIAIDQPATLTSTWGLTKNHQLPLAVTVILFPAILAAPSLLLMLVPHAGLLVRVLSSFTAVFTTTALSLTYRRVWELEHA